MEPFRPLRPATLCEEAAAKIMDISQSFGVSAQAVVVGYFGVCFKWLHVLFRACKCYPARAANGGRNSRKSLVVAVFHEAFSARGLARYAEVRCIPLDIFPVLKPRLALSWTSVLRGCGRARIVPGDSPCFRTISGCIRYITVQGL